MANSNNLYFSNKLYKNFFMSLAGECARNLIFKIYFKYYQSRFIDSSICLKQNIFILRILGLNETFLNEFGLKTKLKIYLEKQWLKSPLALHNKFKILLQYFKLIK